MGQCKPAFERSSGADHERSRAFGDDSLAGVVGPAFAISFEVFAEGRGFEVSRWGLLLLGRDACDSACFCGVPESRECAP